eukprot:scaffold10_cov257-Pinguiococcus_pyrenoidosus.AAC.45
MRYARRWRQRTLSSSNCRVGPVRNSERGRGFQLLLEKDESGNYVPLPELRIDNAEQEGDFRVVTGPVWSKFCSFYPGSGPEIQLEPALQVGPDAPDAEEAFGMEAMTFSLDVACGCDH